MGWRRDRTSRRIYIHSRRAVGYEVLLSRYNDQATGLKTEEYGFDSWQGKNLSYYCLKTGS
jgi:hypothetical protein